MTVEELFTSLYTSVNGNNIRRRVSQGCQFSVNREQDSSREADFIAFCCSQAGMESRRSILPRREGEVKAPAALSFTLRGSSSDTVFAAACGDVSGGAVLFETACFLEKLFTSGKVPRPEQTVTFLYSPEEESLRYFLDSETLRDSSGGVIITFRSQPEKEKCKEKFILHRLNDETPFFQHSLGTKILELLSQISGIEYETKELYFGEYSSGLPRVWLETVYGGGESEKPSSGALKGAAVFVALLACSGTADRRELARLCCEDWKKLYQAKCLEALQLKEDSFESRMLRGIRLSVRCKLALEKAASFGDKRGGCEFTEFVQEKTNAALQLLCGGEIPRFKSEENQEIVELFSDSGQSLFDGRKTVFEIACGLWASRPYKDKESWEELDEEIGRCADAAREIVSRGKGHYRETECVNIETLKKTLKELGVVPGDTLMVHSSYKAFGSFEKGPQGVIQALQESVSESGILAMPGFTDCCDGGSGGIFDREHTPVEPKLGIIPEVFRQSNGVFRSAHPTHSLCAWGRNAKEFLRQENTFDCFASEGPWGRIAESGKIIFLGNTVDSNTFLHACEAWYTNSLDSIQAEADGSMVNIINYPGGCRGNWYGLKEEAPYFMKLRQKGIIHEGCAGKTSVTLMEGPALAAAMKEIFREDPGILLHVSGCRECARRRSLLRTDF